MRSSREEFDHRLQVGYGSSWHLLRLLGWQRARFSEIVAQGIGATDVSWLDFPKYRGSSVYPKGNPILDAEWDRLDFLGDGHPLQAEYDRFWPRSGSQQSWDAVGAARIGGQREWLLVEAKAHLHEIKDTGGGAVSEKSKGMIREAFENTQRSMRCTAPVDQWLNRYYQYSNRLATHYFLNEHVAEMHMPARLVLIYFCGDTYDRGSCPPDAAGWKPTLDEMRATLGLTTESELARRVHEFFLPVNLAG